MRSTIVSVACAVVVCAPAWAEIPPAAKAPLEEVLRGATTDTERAVRLLNGAKLAQDQPVVMVALLEQAVEYGLKDVRTPEAAKAATEALGLLERKAPDRKDAWQAKRLEMAELLYRYAGSAEKAAVGKALLQAYLDKAEEAEKAGRWQDAGDLYRRAYPIAYGLKLPRKEMVAFLRQRAAHFDSIARRIDTGRKALVTDPSITSTRETLLLLLLAEMRDPLAAVKLLTDDVAPAWRTYAPLAAKGPAALTPAGAAELGHWLHEFLAPKSSKYSRLGVLLSARDCYVRATESRSAAEAGQMTLRMTLRTIDLEIEKIAMLPETAGWWAYAEMLRAVDPDRATKSGVWRMEASGLTVWPMPGGHLRVPATIAGDYRLSVRYSHRKVRTALSRWADRFGAGGLARGNPGMGVVFPVGERHLAFSLKPEQGGATATLYLIQPASSGPKTDQPDTEGATGPGGRRGDTSRRGPSRGWPGTPGGGRRPGPPSGRSPDRKDDEDWRDRPAEKIPSEQTVTAKAPAMATDRAYQVDIAVFVDGNTARVAVQLDRKPLLRWQGAVERCSPPRSWSRAAAENTVLLGGAMGPTAFASVKLCPLTGRLDVDD